MTETGWKWYILWAAGRILDFGFWICDIENDPGDLYNTGIYKFKIQNLESKIPK
jgi:hypothetical protein